MRKRRTLVGQGTIRNRSTPKEFRLDRQPSIVSVESRHVPLASDGNGLLQRYAEVSNFALKILDIIILVGCGYLVFWFQRDTLILPDRYLLYMLLMSLGAYNLFLALGVYQAWRGQSLTRELTRLLWSWSLLIIIAGAFLFLTKTGESFSRLWVGWTSLLAFLGMTTLRVCTRLFLRSLRSRGFNIKRVVVVGAGELGSRALRALHQEAWAGLQPVAVFDDLANNDKQIEGVPVVGNIESLPKFIEDNRKREGRHEIDQVWIALPLESYRRVSEIQQMLQNSAANVYFVPDFYGFDLVNHTVNEIVGLPVMNMSASPLIGMNALLKRSEDIILSSLALIALLPLLIVISILVKVDSPGSVLFRQRRYGLDAKEIIVWKFRTMTVSEDGDKITQTSRDDVRVTRIGRFLRKFSLDELPQLVNVLQGTMSLVGPRPHAVAHNEEYRSKIVGYMSRHRMRPGMTGWAQVNGLRGETTDQSLMERRVDYDLEYIRNWSVLFDLLIIFKTFWVLTETKDVY